MWRTVSLSSQTSCSCSPQPYEANRYERCSRVRSLAVSCRAVEVKPPLEQKQIAKQQLKICTSKACKKQGAEQILKHAEDLALANVEVEACGCLGACGKGPNLVILPEELKLSHVKTPADLREAVSAFCNAEIDKDQLKCNEMRQAGNEQARTGNLATAIDLYTQGLQVGGDNDHYKLYANRSGARLALGDKLGALEDADKAAELAPPSFTTAAVRQVEANMKLGRYKEAALALDKAADNNKQFARSKDFISLVRQLQAVLQQA